MSQRSVRKYIDVCRSCLCTFAAKINNSKDFLLITVDYRNLVQLNVIKHILINIYDPTPDVFSHIVPNYFGN
jgi:hypothetical protein